MSKYSSFLAYEKSNEITAIPELLKALNIKGNIVTIDAMGCQKEIVKLIKKMRGDYLISLKGNQSTLHDDIRRYFEDSLLRRECDYHKVLDKAHSAVETREYWQTTDVAWLPQKKLWAGLTSIVMTKNTISKDDKTRLCPKLNEKVNFS